MTTKNIKSGESTTEKGNGSSAVFHKGGIKVDDNKEEQAGRVTEEFLTRYDKLVKFLSDEICMHDLYSDSYNLHVHLMYDGICDTTKIVLKAAEQAGFRIPYQQIYPYNPDMKIYINRVVTAENRIIYTTPSLAHYTADNIEASNAPYFVVKGGDFRVVEVKLSTGQVLYQKYDEGRVQVLDRELVKEYELINDGPLKSIFAVIEKNHLREERQFTELTDEEIIAILQNHKEFEYKFLEMTSLYYSYSESEAKNNTSYLYIGKVSLVDMGNNFYQYSTGPVKLVKAEKNGVIDGYTPKAIKPGDWLILRESEEKISFFPSSLGITFAAYLCDSDGNILDNTPHYPWEDLSSILASVAASSSKASNTHEEALTAIDKSDMGEEVGGVSESHLLGDKGLGEIESPDHPL